MISNTITLKKLSLVLTGTAALLILLLRCAEKEIQGSAFYHFDYQGEDYRIRTVVTTDDGKVYNELIGNKFVAVDYDQDGILDEITLGTINTNDAQNIYGFALDMLTTQNKVATIKPKLNSYRILMEGYTCEMKTFHKDNSEPFNQFKVVEKDANETNDFIIGIDYNADGILDTVALGNMSLEQIQALHSEVIDQGLKDNVLLKVDSKIIVK